MGGGAERQRPGLVAADARGLAGESEFEAESRLEAEVGYGLGLRRAPGVLTPYEGASLADGDNRTWRTGALWQMGNDAALDVEASHAGEAGNALMLRAQFSF